MEVISKEERGSKCGQKPRSQGQTILQGHTQESVWSRGLPASQRLLQLTTLQFLGLQEHFLKAKLPTFPFVCPLETESHVAQAGLELEW